MEKLREVKRGLHLDREEENYAEDGSCVLVANGSNTRMEDNYLHTS
jgi:hypothetical protein